MKRFINELKYLNRGMPTSTKIILGVIIAYILLSFGKNILFNPSIFINIAILLFSLLVHEISHGVMAYICGDNTAKNYGRLSLNPLHHLDPLEQFSYTSNFIWLFLYLWLGKTCTY